MSGIKDAREALQRGLGDTARVSSLTMSYVEVEPGLDPVQVLAAFGEIKAAELAG